MKQIPIALQTAYEKPGTSTCFLVKIVTKEDGIFAFTTADFSMNFDDGFGIVRYRADQEMMPQNIQTSADMTVDNTKLLGWFSEALEQKILSGAMDSAEITIYRVSYLRLNYGYEIIAYGTVGEIEYNSDAKDKRKIEFRSLTQQLTQIVNQFYSLTCRAQFGDDRCGMPFVWFNGTIFAVGTNPFLQVTVSGIAQPANYFELGICNFVNGPNAGLDLEVESWTIDPANAARRIVKFSYLSSYAITPTTQVRFRRDCGKTEQDCIDYGNIINMRAEHLTPVEDKSLMVPGAYIRSQNAK